MSEDASDFLPSWHTLPAMRKAVQGCRGCAALAALVDDFEAVVKALGLVSSSLGRGTPQS